ncbi:non-hydrolyzing UDP-N-acetylglucosamine 2-epimerase [Ferruginivarius sediminum]|nr:UDP-N-acetylglucosamine 2-epimerase (non-hydrolyzing) [Ferruginivarius sediminum]
MTSGRKTFQRSELTKEICVVVGTRPGIVMMAPLIHELGRRQVPHFVVHTGQHYSPAMDADLFEDLGLPQADYRLEGVAERRTHGGQTAGMLEGSEKVFMERRPRVVVVNGDANTNLAAALAARKLHMIVAHTEAGVRSGDWRMPEEHNRVIMDHISDLLFASDTPSVRALEQERVRGEIHRSGNTIVDASVMSVAKAETGSSILERLGLEPGNYSIGTLHREETVDVPEYLQTALTGIAEAADNIGRPAIFFLHPRTYARLKEFGLLSWVKNLNGLVIHPAVSYLDFQRALSNAAVVFTDSGGVQQEACIHKVPCVTVKDSSEWPETIDISANRVTGLDVRAIVEAANEAIEGAREWPIPFGDGAASARIVDVLERCLIEDPSLAPLPVVTADRV